MIATTRLRRVGLLAGLLLAGLVAVEFPYDVDAPASTRELEESRKYYADAYGQGAPSQPEQPPSEYETKYLKVAIQAAQDSHISEMVQSFVERYGLQKRPVLEIGSGRGYLQDIAEDYTGLDISPNVSRFYHKKFVLGSATALPFPDNSFDGGWSIWVFEHIPNPEQALSEWRRVLRDRAVILLFPAWSCNSWVANGYAVRPYSAFGLGGKLVKASIPMRASLPFRVLTRIPARIIRDVASRFGPTRLHYRRLIPNYKEYWQPDSDAVNSLDRHEVMLWFRSRGDRCLNCEGREGSVLMRSDPLVMQIRKPA